MPIRKEEFMWTAVVDFFKGLFGGKGAIQMQMGKDNQAISSTVGDVAGPVVMGNDNTVNIHPPATATEKTIEPTAEEVEILLRLADSPTGYLHKMQSDAGFMVVIDGTTLGIPYDQGSSVKMHEAVERLLKLGLLTDINKDSEILHLSSKGKEAAGQIRKQLESGERTDFSEIERLMPELLAEMKQDYSDAPLIREFIILDNEGNRYGGDDVFAYYRSKHENLDSKFQILENHGLVTNITNNSTDRYRVMEKFARYLTKTI
jgi:hypothetical protein